MYKKPVVKRSFNISGMQGNLPLTDAWSHSTTNPWANHSEWENHSAWDNWSGWSQTYAAGWVAGWVAYA